MLACSTTRRVIWLSETEKGKGYAVDFLDITLHAVSRDLEAYPSPCIYTQVVEKRSLLFLILY
jgi:chloride channel, nucleotide-sensitive, 1A